MHKDNTKTNTPNIDVFNLIADPKNYQLLISNKWVSFRKDLARELDKIFIPRVGYTGWKQRFLYPEKNIPKKDFEMIATAMEENLARQLEKQLDYVHNQIAQKQNDAARMHQEIENLETIISESINAIKKYQQNGN